MVLLDSYSEINQDADGNLKDLHPSDSVEKSQRGQTFTCPGWYKITSAKFYMKKFGSPTGNGHAVLYAHTGTYGTNGVPTGAVLATSDDFDVSSLTTGRVVRTFTFTGAQQYIMSANYYCILFENPTAGTINGTNYPMVSHDNGGTHPGNRLEFANGSYVSDDTRDVCFYVYGEAVAPPAANPLIGKPFISPDMIRKAKIR